MGFLYPWIDPHGLAVLRLVFQTESPWFEPCLSSSCKHGRSVQRCVSKDMNDKLSTIKALNNTLGNMLIFKLLDLFKKHAKIFRSKKNTIYVNNLHKEQYILVNKFFMEVCRELSYSYLWLSPAEHYCMPNSMHLGVVEILTEE